MPRSTSGNTGANRPRGAAWRLFGPSRAEIVYGPTSRPPRRDDQHNARRTRTRPRRIAFFGFQVIRAQEDERRRIPRELHDDTAQVLFAQLLRLTTLKSSPDPVIHATAATLEQMTAEALEGVRRLALELRPPALDDLGLSAALGELAQRFAEQLDIHIDYQARGLRGSASPEIELVLYRVAQEALTNIAKHANASAVSLDVDRNSEDVTLSIRDDGDGFDRSATSISDGRGLGLGLFGMEERVALVGGRFRIWSQIHLGTEIFAFIPVPDQVTKGQKSS